MREHLKQLIQPRMKWKSAEIVPKSGTTSSPVYLMYRDPVAAIRSLLDRPALAKHITYQPRRCWKDKQAGNRRYSEIFTADWAWETQVNTRLPALISTYHLHSPPLLLVPRYCPFYSAPTRRTSQIIVETRVRGLCT